MIGYMIPGSGLIRYSAIVRHLLAQGEDKLADGLVAEVEAAGRTCKEHGKLDDPIVSVDTVRTQIVVGCPLCSGAEVLAVWESQG